MVHVFSRASISITINGHWGNTFGWSVYGKQGSIWCEHIKYISYFLGCVWVNCASKVVIVWFIEFSYIRSNSSHMCLVVFEWMNFSVNFLSGWKTKIIWIGSIYTSVYQWKSYCYQGIYRCGWKSILAQLSWIMGVHTVWINELSEN